jgi:gamma-glutamylcyclotransferase (GGCT)/AIG2-like uncharacterized protein YtfP
MGRDEESAARRLCDALNRAWNARAQLAPGPPPDSDWPLVKGLICGLPADDSLAFLRSSEVRELVAIEPPVMNHWKLRGHGVLGSVDEIPEPVRHEASEAHRKLRRRLDELPEDPSPEENEAALVRLADLLYVIRSNLQHGEKFASPDAARIARDRVIAEKAAVIELVFDFLFDRPSATLVAYGSLAPGGVHHGELDGVGGEWIPVFVRGQLQAEGAFPRFTPTPAAKAVPAELLRRADDLPDRWRRLDQLEGDLYRRVLVAAETHDGELVIANLYAA